jgi:hypothetical protein
MTTQVLTPANNPSLYRCLFTLKTANMNSTSDQFFAALGNITSYIVVNIYCTNASISLTTAVGGIWTGAGQTGNNLVGSGQAYSALTGSTKLLALTLASGATGNLQTTGPILHLATPQGATATADFYCFGLDLSR